MSKAKSKKFDDHMNFLKNHVVTKDFKEGAISFLKGVNFAIKE
jgi:hypothetical protein